MAREVFGEALLGAYLHGSAVMSGGLRPTSDVDVLAVVSRPTTVNDRARLISRVMPISGSPVPSSRWRPVELTVVTHADVVPWSYPPVMQFMYGEWLKKDYQRGFVPEPAPNPDLATLLKVAIDADHPLAGPSVSELLEPVPPDDLRRALVADIAQLMSDLETDTRNVLLTLARIWQTLATGEIKTKDDAAAWAAARLEAPVSLVVARAGENYAAGTHGRWRGTMPQARIAASKMLEEIRLFTG